MIFDFNFWISRIRWIKNSVKIYSKNFSLIQNLTKGHMIKCTIIDNGRNNQIIIKNALLKNTTCNIQGDLSIIEIGEDSIVENCNFYLSGNNQVVKIEAKTRIRNTSFWLEDGDNRVEIGPGTTIEGAHLAATEPRGAINIGEDCMLSYDIDIRNGDSHSILTIDKKERINYAKNIIIEDHVWIGAHSIILKGCHIGKENVIGTGSVLSHLTTGPNCLIAGSPAKIIKNDITWERDRLKWYKSFSNDSTSG
jgi:acetyltransferase-like isoleucine patch superfamily enzyme